MKRQIDVSFPSCDQLLTINFYIKIWGEANGIVWEQHLPDRGKCYIYGLFKTDIAKLWLKTQLYVC